jgi:hypothetical protein
MAPQARGHDLHAPGPELSAKRALSLREAQRALKGRLASAELGSCVLRFAKNASRRWRRAVCSIPLYLVQWNDLLRCIIGGPLHYVQLKLVHTDHKKGKRSIRLNSVVQNATMSHLPHFNSLISCTKCNGTSSGTGVKHRSRSAKHSVPRRGDSLVRSTVH